MRIDTYKCDRCGAEAKPTGVPKFPTDWARLSIELPWAKDPNRWVKRDLCTLCTEAVLHHAARFHTHTEETP